MFSLFSLVNWAIAIFKRMFVLFLSVVSCESVCKCRMYSLLFHVNFLTILLPTLVEVSDTHVLNSTTVRQL